MKSDDIYRSQFRLPFELYEKLKAEADKHHRSLNAEIVSRLAQSFEPISTGPKEADTRGTSFSPPILSEMHLKAFEERIQKEHEQHMAEIRKTLEEYLSSRDDDGES